MFTIEEYPQDFRYCRDSRSFIVDIRKIKGSGDYCRKQVDAYISAWAPEGCITKYKKYLSKHGHINFVCHY